MTTEEFENILINVSNGSEFSAAISIERGGDGTFVKGKIHISEDKKRFWCCYDDGPSGDRSPNFHNFKRSWVITRDNHNTTIKDFTIINSEPVVINNYSIY